MKIKNILLTGFATAAALAAMAPAASADTGASAGDAAVGAAAGAFDAVADDLDLRQITSSWNIETLDDSPIVDHLVRAVEESPEIVSGLADVTGSPRG
ncbi:hypothetical protein [Streptomyces sp. NPDC059874]|uniref:hypothetical protein n=1 Tax=Streptomyces sp. NPDC059874 TaxID=3346983 RepID=UPI00365C3BBD